ncbi:MAG: chemotaxis protein CheB [Nitrospinae bacterium]|nr:chemotaxis protein CheB [Nitrospinota bacterium]MZH13868.1 chemotaxis protein CheB [Nitrospinota bacterium]
MEKQKILIVDDESKMIQIFRRNLPPEDYILDGAVNGMDALDKLRSNQYQAVVTDWLMPDMNGVQLIKSIRSEFEKPPLIIMITVIDSLQAKENILDIGADYFLPKPVDFMELFNCLKNGLARIRQTPKKIKKINSLKKPAQLPPCVAVVLAASTAGCDALRKVFYRLPACNAAFFVVQHGPFWMHQELTKRIQSNTELNVCLAKNYEKIQPGNIYIAPGDLHLSIKPEFFCTELLNSPMENFVRPSADPLFRSAAEVFGRFVIGVILTGLGMDGTYGAAYVNAAEGIVLAHDPKTAHAPTMPKAIISSGLAHQVVSLEKMQATILQHVENLSRLLME